MLLGNRGQIQNVGATDQPVVNAQSVVQGPKGPLLDRQGVPYEDPQNLVVTFSSFQPGTSFTSAFARIEWGAGGIQHSMGPMRFTPGLQIPVRGSWIRVVMLGSAFPYTAGAQVSYGRCDPGIVLIAQLALVPAVARTFTFDFSQFVTHYRVVPSNSTTMQLNVTYPAVGPVLEQYDLSTGGTDVWHPRVLQPAQLSDTLSIVDNAAGGGNASVLGLVSQ